MNRCNFVMRVTDRTRADIKGGTIMKHEGHIRLLEIAQSPKEHLEDFKSVKKFGISNTNNLWATVSRGQESPTTHGKEWEDIAG